MIANILNTLSQVISRAASDSNSSVRGRRNDRRYPISWGVEGLEMRLAPTVIAPVLVTVTNQPPVPAPTTTTTTTTPTTTPTTTTTTTTTAIATVTPTKTVVVS